MHPMAATDQMISDRQSGQNVLNIPLTALCFRASPFVSTSTGLTQFAASGVNGTVLYDMNAQLKIHRKDHVSSEEYAEKGQRPSIVRTAT
jgi:hypothetical protein